MAVQLPFLTFAIINLEAFDEKKKGYFYSYSILSLNGIAQDYLQKKKIYQI